MKRRNRLYRRSVHSAFMHRRNWCWRSAAYRSFVSGTEVAPDEVEKYIPRNTCALIKGLIGFKLTDKCPYMQVANLIVGETTRC